MIQIILSLNNDDDFVLVGLETTPFLRVVPFQQCHVTHMKKKVINNLFFIAVPIGTVRSEKLDIKTYIKAHSSIRIGILAWCNKLNHRFMQFDLLIDDISLGIFKPV